MKKIKVVKYKCDFCGKIFDMIWECRYHEEEKHKCPNCVHSYYVYGCELNCVLKNKNKRCRFKQIKHDK